MYILINPKKGEKTIITIFALLFLIFVFIVFIFLFKLSAENKTGKIAPYVSSIQTELVLKNFLRTPAPNTRTEPVEDLTPDVGEGDIVTNADLIAWTCDKEEKNYKKNYKALKESINNFFDDTFGSGADKWNLEIIYSNPDFKKKGFGHANLLEAFWLKIKYNEGYLTTKLISLMPSHPINLQILAFFATERGPGFATQIIPCSDRTLAMVILKSSGYTIVEGLKVPE